VFVTTCFNSDTSLRCPEPLLPVSQSLRGDSATGGEQGQGATRETQDRIGTSGQWAAGSTPGGILTTSVTSKWHKGTGGPSGSEHYNLVVEPVAYSIREDAKANNFSATEIETARALQALQPSVQSHHAQTFITQEADPLIFENSYRDGIRMGKQGLSQTLSAKMGTGGLNTPMIAQEVKPSGIIGSDIVGPLMASDYKFPQQQQVDENKVIVQGVAPTLVVRRLTPLECERLMGWPDQHTAQGTNGVISDSQRFKMCGNGVASPVAAWIARHILAV
jgi:DNA (cytosine-5)-methyltransferase 1